MVLIGRHTPSLFFSVMNKQFRAPLNTAVSPYGVHPSCRLPLVAVHELYWRFTAKKTFARLLYRYSAFMQSV